MTSALVAIVTAIIVTAVVGAAVNRAHRRSGVRAWIFVALWLTIPSGLALSGALEDFSAFPPPMMGVLAAVLATALVFAFSGWGTAIRDYFSLTALIGFHTFRAMPEVLLALAHSEGLAPVQMSIEGRNWDALTAATAFLIYLQWRDAAPPRWVAIAWSVVGIGLLANIVTIAVLSMPTPLRVFHNEPANTFVATFPYVLLPAVHVTAAVGGHLLIFRKLARR